MLLKSLRAVMIGAPGSGKGTISSRIVQYFGVTHVSSGDLLRLHAQRHTELGEKARAYMEAGQLVPDHLVEQLVMETLRTSRSDNLLLDGFPRTTHQARSLDSRFPINVALSLVVPAEAIVERIAGRWVHLASGRVYNTHFNPPRVQGLDDETGEPLVQRADDSPSAVLKRLEVFSATMRPVLDFYRAAGVLREFRGSESNRIWPEVYQHLATLIQPALALPSPD